MILCVLPTGYTVESDGECAVIDGTRWLHIKAKVEGQLRAGFCCIRFLNHIEG